MSCHRWRSLQKSKIRILLGEQNFCCRVNYIQNVNVLHVLGSYLFTVRENTDSSAKTNRHPFNLNRSLKRAKSLSLNSKPLNLRNFDGDVYRGRGTRRRGAGRPPALPPPRGLDRKNNRQEQTGHRTTAGHGRKGPSKDRNPRVYLSPKSGSGGRVEQPSTG